MDELDTETTDLDYVIGFHAVNQHIVQHSMFFQPFFGFTMVSCEKGDVRQTPDGLLIYGETEQREVSLPAGARGREAEVEELYNAVVHKRPVFHDGRWGAATLEVCLAMLESAKERKEIFLSHQVPSPE